MHLNIQEVFVMEQNKPKSNISQVEVVIKNEDSLFIVLKYKVNLCHTREGNGIQCNLCIAMSYTP